MNQFQIVRELVLRALFFFLERQSREKETTKKEKKSKEIAIGFDFTSSPWRAQIKCHDKRTEQPFQPLIYIQYREVDVRARMNKKK